MIILNERIEVKLLTKQKTRVFYLIYCYLFRMEMDMDNFKLYVIAEKLPFEISHQGQPSALNLIENGILSLGCISKFDITIMPKKRPCLFTHTSARNQL